MEKQAGGNRAGTGLLGPGRSAAMTPRQLIEPARLAGSALLHTQSDARLVDLARAGNDRAFEAIVARYRRPLLGYCERLLPPGRAEDAVQQAFLNAYRAIGRNEAELNLRPWLYRVAHNSSLNLLRQNGWDYDEIPEDFDGAVRPASSRSELRSWSRVRSAAPWLPGRPITSSSAAPVTPAAPQRRQPRARAAVVDPAEVDPAAGTARSAARARRGSASRPRSGTAKQHRAVSARAVKPPAPPEPVAAAVAARAGAATATRAATEARAGAATPARDRAV